MLFVFLQEAFKAFHNDLGKVRKYLKPIHLGQVAERSQKDEEVQKDFEELRNTVHKLVRTGIYWSKLRGTRETLCYVRDGC